MYLPCLNLKIPSQFHHFPISPLVSSMSQLCPPWNYDIRVKVAEVWLSVVQLRSLKPCNILVALRCTFLGMLHVSQDGGLDIGTWFALTIYGVLDVHDIVIRELLMVFHALQLSYCCTWWLPPISSFFPPSLCHSVCFKIIIEKGAAIVYLTCALLFVSCIFGFLKYTYCVLMEIGSHCWESLICMPAPV